MQEIFNLLGLGSFFNAYDPNDLSRLNPIIDGAIIEAADSGDKRAIDCLPKELKKCRQKMSFSEMLAAEQAQKNLAATKMSKSQRKRNRKGR